MDPHAPPSLLAPLHRLLADERRRQATDRDLLHAFVQRSENDAFAELLRRHGPMVLRLALHLLRHRQDAEDVFQATFLTLARKAHSLRCESSVAAWLHRVAWRLAIRSRAASQRRTAGVSRLVEDHQPAYAGRSPQCCPADEISLREAQELLHQELAALPERLRLPLVLCYLQGRTRDEAARRLGWSLATLKRRLEQGRKLLHLRLSRRGVTLPAVLSALLLSATEMSASLIESTRSLAASTLAGSARLPASVALLLAEASSSAKAKAVWGLLLMLGACAGAGAWAYSGPNGAPAAPPAEAATPQNPPSAAKADEKPRPGQDQFGDPLPPGAIARLGTVRLRHGDYLSSIRFAPDGKTLISMGLDGVRVWNSATGKLVRHFGAGLMTRSMTLSSDGRRIALSRWHAGAGSPVEIWDVATGKLIHKLGNRHYRQIHFSPDGKQLAALAGDDGPGRIEVGWNIDLWDAQTGRNLLTLTGEKEFVSDMAFSADGKTLMLGGSGKTISLRSTADGKEVRCFSDLPADVYSFISSSQGDRVAFIELWQKKVPGGLSSWGPGEQVLLLDSRTGAVLQRWSVKPKFEGRNGILENGWWSLAFSPDGRRLAACQMNGPVRIWDTTTGAEKQLLPQGRGHSGGVAFSPDGKTLAIGDGGRLIRLIDAQTGADRVPVQGPRGCVTAVALSGDGKTAFTAAEKGILQRWDALTGRPRGRLADLKADVLGLLFSPDGRTLLSQTYGETLRAWDVDASEQRWSRYEASDTWSRLALSPDGTTLAVSGDLASTALKLIKTATGKCLHILSTKTPIWDVAFAPDASVVFALTGRWTVHRWETASGRILPDLRLPAASEVPYHEASARGAGESAVLSPDGRLAAYAHDDKLLCLFDVLGQREIHRFTALPGAVAKMAFAADGRSFVWAERSGILHWLELATWSERRTFSGHAGAVRQMVFSRDGKRLVSASEDTTALVWNLLENAPPSLSAAQRDACWTDLADKDAAKAYRAMCRLIAAPAEALALLRQHLKPVKGEDEKRIQRLITELDSDAFTEREKATQELRKLGELAGPACRKALATRPALELSRRLQELLDDIGQRQWRLSAEDLRQLRALEVLERLDTPEARRLLESLAGGAEGARQTQEARAALQRLRR